MVTPKQSDPQFKLRLPSALKEQIERAALAANRSMNAEIVARLEASFLNDPQDVAGIMRDYSNKMDRQLTDLREERDRLKKVTDALTAKLPRSLLE